MKRGTPGHPKTLTLAGLLGVERWGAVGVLESLWHFAGQYARRGDVGRHRDVAIAQGIGWSGDAKKLISALVESGWLDRCPCHRLRVHDWPDHADQAVSRTREVADTGYLPCYQSLPGSLENSSGPPAQTVGGEASGTGLPAQASGREGGTGEGGAALVLSPGKEARQALDLARAPKPPRDTWLTPYCDAWRERWGAESEPPHGEMARELKAAAGALHGDHAECVARWRRFLAQADRAEWARPARFLQGLGQWSAGGREPPRPVTRREADAVAMIRGGLAVGEAPK